MHNLETNSRARFRIVGLRRLLVPVPEPMRMRKRGRGGASPLDNLYGFLLQTGKVMDEKLEILQNTKFSW